MNISHHGVNKAQNSRWLWYNFRERTFTSFHPARHARTLASSSIVRTFPTRAVLLLSRLFRAIRSEYVRAWARYDVSGMKNGGRVGEMYKFDFSFGFFNYVFQEKFWTSNCDNFFLLQVSVYHSCPSRYIHLHLVIKSIRSNLMLEYIFNDCHLIVKRFIIARGWKTWNWFTRDLLIHTKSTRLSTYHNSREKTTTIDLSKCKSFPRVGDKEAMKKIEKSHQCMPSAKLRFMSGSLVTFPVSW